MSDIRTTGTRTVYENRWMRVREDAIVRQDGSPGIYGVVEKTDFAIIAPVDNGVIHLVEQYRYPVQGRYWELPQGSWEDAPGTDPLELARAELREETGLTAQTMRHVGHLFECYGYSNQGFHIYLAQGLRQGEARREHAEQDMISRAFPLDQVMAMITEGIIKDAATVATLGLLRLKGLI
ncbi:NUDIX domain-containing protein [Microvirga lotononidis]|uniref:GDP-mannose pyrophosphatase n=1 Tax=Microvirga lotononidis TaxID=864069 RepID=I4YWZ7_9HYPH|nr:NUDIX hydrolase [Microvirga lotononidis]EIM28489.1 NTP pyrophosphohydrolase [Microvirga lotononidis]WQO27438.1 NUDIX hydrolase [Microvirga lotononidis]